MRLRTQAVQRTGAGAPSSGAGISMPSALAVFRLMPGPVRSGLMSELGQKAKYSLRTDVFRFGPNIGHRSIGSACPFGCQQETHAPQQTAAAHASGRLAFRTLEGTEFIPGFCRLDASQPHRLATLGTRKNSDLRAAI